jgi:outer membrane protein TolC
MKKTVMVFNLLLLCLFTFGKETLTLNKAIEKALNNNIQLSSMKENLKAGKENLNFFKKQKFGDLYFNAGITSMSDNSLIRPMTKELLMSGVENMPFDDNYTYWNLTYSVPLYLGGKLKESEKIAKKNKEAVFSSIEQVKQEIKFNTTKLFLSIVSIEKQIKAYNNYISFLNSLKKHTVKGVETGKYPEINVLKINYQIEQANSTLTELKQADENLVNSLIVLLGENKNNYSFEYNEKFNATLNNYDISKLINTALTNRNDLKTAKLSAEIKKSQIKINSSDRKPKIFVKADLTTVNAGNIDFNDSFWSVSANISIPVFDMGKRKSKIKVAKHLYKSSLKVVDNKKLEIEKEVKNAYFGLKKAYQDIQTANAAYELQQEVARIEEIKYEGGRGDIDDLLLARANLSLSKTKVIKSQFDFLIANENLKKTIEGDVK